MIMDLYSLTDGAIIKRTGEQLHDNSISRTDLTAVAEAMHIKHAKDIIDR